MQRGEKARSIGEVFTPNQTLPPPYPLQKKLASSPDCQNKFEEGEVNTLALQQHLPHLLPTYKENRMVNITSTDLVSIQHSALYTCGAKHPKKSGGFIHVKFSPL